MNAGYGKQRKELEAGDAQNAAKPREIARKVNRQVERNARGELAEGDEDPQLSPYSVRDAALTLVADRTFDATVFARLQQ